MMNDDPASGRQVTDDLRRRIDDGELSEEPDEIAGFHGVLRRPIPVQRVESQQRLSRERRAQNTGAFLADAAQHGFTPSTGVEITFEPAQDFSDLFSVNAMDELVVRDRVQHADGKPVQISTSRMPRSLTRGTVLEETNTGPGGTYARLEEMGCELTEFEERLTGGPALPHEQSLLGKHVRAVTRVRRLAYSGTTVVEVNDMTVPADQYEYVYRFPAT